MPVRILAIETSCDETAAAVCECGGALDAPTFEVKSNAVHSQVEAHREFGGVVPSLAKREHAKNLAAVLAEALK
ncbi:MAG TPA: tRNA (adenosine(37)-N6)-threonylcarbamoyltransferase complex transferase subunit TsaD, partial [Candidatus Paceibacterota bacterium]